MSGHHILAYIYGVLGNNYANLIFSMDGVSDSTKLHVKETCNIEESDVIVIVYPSTNDVFTSYKPVRRYLKRHPEITNAKKNVFLIPVCKTADAVSCYRNIGTLIGSILPMKLASCNGNKKSLDFCSDTTKKSFMVLQNEFTNRLADKMASKTDSSFTLPVIEKHLAEATMKIPPYVPLPESSHTLH